MAWKEIVFSPPHRTYLLLSAFLILYTLFASFIRNRLHLSEPPIALLFGIGLGPKGLGWVTPNSCNTQGCLDQNLGKDDKGWGWGDDVIQEITRVVVGIQVFTIGLSLPRQYFSKNWKSISVLLGPVMVVGWLVCAALACSIFQLDIWTALTVAATLTPTDPVLSASILSNSQFSTRLPPRLRRMLAAESGLNDGVSYPFLYLGLTALNSTSVGQALKEYFLITILWQCTFGIVLGCVIGVVFRIVMRYAEDHDYAEESGLVAFYLLLAVLSIGAGSSLGISEFLVAFAAGYGFSRDSRNRKKIQKAHLPEIVDLLLNSAMFVYFGTIIPWHSFQPQSITPMITPLKLTLFACLVLCFRRIPAMMALYKWTPNLRTSQEALFCGHFGPMGLGALFLAIEARAVLETGTGEPLPHPPSYTAPFSNVQRAIEVIWPIAAFTVLCSTIVHGFSVLFISLADHFRRHEAERAPLLGAETDRLPGTEFDSETEGDDTDRA